MASSTDDSKQRYQAVLRTIAANSSPMQLPGVTVAQIITHIGGPYGRYDRGEITSTLRAAQQNDDIISWTDADGRARLTLTVEDDLKRVVGYLNEHGYPAERIEPIVDVIREVRADA